MRDAEDGVPSDTVPSPALLVPVPQCVAGVRLAVLEDGSISGKAPGGTKGDHPFVDQRGRAVLDVQPVRMRSVKGETNGVTHVGPYYNKEGPSIASEPVQSLLAHRGLQLPPVSISHEGPPGMAGVLREGGCGRGYDGKVAKRGSRDVVGLKGVRAARAQDYVVGVFHAAM